MGSFEGRRGRNGSWCQKKKGKKNEKGCVRATKLLKAYQLGQGKKQPGYC